jgi:hypothetical protein
MTWPATGVLRLRLVRGASVLARTQITIRDGRATGGMRLGRRLRRGRYTVIVARRDGTIVQRLPVRAS